MERTKTLWVSASKLSTYDKCPAQIKFKYIDKIPELDRDYFEYGKLVEDKFKILLDGGSLERDCPEANGAYALYNDPEVKKLFANGYTAYQWEHKRIRSKANPSEYHSLGKDERYHPDGGEIGLIWFTDFETDDYTIDIKTAANGRGEKDVMGAKRQAKMYILFRGWKPVKFVVLNKKTFAVKIFTVSTNNFSDFLAKIEELKIAYDNELLFPKPSFMACKFCSFSALCDKGRWSGI